jgi:hypothetical protein
LFLLLLLLLLCCGAGGVDGCGGGIVALVVPAAAAVQENLLSSYSYTFCGVILGYEIKYFLTLPRCNGKLWKYTEVIQEKPSGVYWY